MTAQQQANTSEVPEWALLKGYDLTYGNCPRDSKLPDNEKIAHMRGMFLGEAFARYIATHAPKPAPRLLTEGEWAAIWNEHYTTQSFAEWVAPYRERGLIAAEPVDALEQELRHAFNDLHWAYQDRDVREVAFRIRRLFPGIDDLARQIDPSE